MQGEQGGTPRREYSTMVWRVVAMGRGAGTYHRTYHIIPFGLDHDISCLERT